VVGGSPPKAGGQADRFSQKQIALFMQRVGRIAAQGAAGRPGGRAVGYLTAELDWRRRLEEFSRRLEETSNEGKSNFSNGLAIFSKVIEPGPKAQDCWPFKKNHGGADEFRRRSGKVLPQGRPGATASYVIWGGVADVLIDKGGAASSPSRMAEETGFLRAKIAPSCGDCMMPAAPATIQGGQRSAQPGYKIFQGIWFLSPGRRSSRRWGRGSCAH